MIERDLYDYVQADIPDAVVYWGKISKDEDFDTDPIISFIKVPSSTNQFTPVYLDNFQFTIRHKYIDKVTEYMNKVITSLQFKEGNIGSYQVYVPGVLNNGILYEEEDIVAGIVTISIRYIGL